VTDPANNYTIYTFASGFEIYHQTFTSSGTLLLSVGTCYNNAAPNCSGQTSVTSPFSEVDVYTYIPGVASPSVVKRTYNSTYGLLTRVQQFDFGGAKPAADTTISYGSYSNGNCAAIGNY